MDRNEAEKLSYVLKDLACIGCTKNWLENNCDSTDPIQDIKDCASFGFISPELQHRLLKEVSDIQIAN